MLKPKNQNDLFRSVELHFVGGALSDMRVHDNLNTVTNFHFSDVKMNPSLGGGVFKFKTPKGVQLIKNK